MNIHNNENRQAGPFGRAHKLMIKNKSILKSLFSVLHERQKGHAFWVCEHTNVSALNTFPTVKELASASHGILCYKLQHDNFHIFF